MNARTVVILSDNADFARGIVSRWTAERQTPNFTLLGTAVWSAAAAVSCDAVIAGPVDSADWIEKLHEVERAGKPLLCIAADVKNARAVRQAVGSAAVIAGGEECVDTAVVCGCEMLRRVEASSRASAAEESARQSERHAVLGRYMLDQRHAINNALTSVLGNAELLLLEPGTLTAGMRDQIRTIHNMAVRIHETMQRFSSVETEMRVGEIESQAETSNNARAIASGR